MNEKIQFKTGQLSLDELEGIMSGLGLEVTFIDRDDVIQYYSDPEVHIFTRKPENLGIDVRDCHKPESHATINEMLEKFRAGEARVAEMWIKHKGMYVYIKYVPVRNQAGEYLGTLEITQSIDRIRKIRGIRTKMLYT